MQSLANWRVRGYGPPFDPSIRGRGNKIFYRPDHLIHWASDGKIESWQFCRDWLEAKEITVDHPCEASIRWLAASIDPFLE
ncbi:hypothetical protein [Devosia sp. Naph2]|uniref:hypothetical protein n=1 Tax=Devosia polycyclovorans TaxID=3345148 RepID=UPI0035CEF553